MSGRPVRDARGVTVIGGGEVAAADLEAALAIAPVLVAADGGADRALELGQPPDWVIGDLDSISDRARRLIPRERVIGVAEQDSTDFGKCLERIEAPLVLAVGFAGLRLDHTLAALTLLVRHGAPRGHAQLRSLLGQADGGLPADARGRSGDDDDAHRDQT